MNTLTNQILEICAHELKKNNWDIQPPVTLIGPQRPAISAFKKKQRFDITIILDIENLSVEEIINIQQTYIENDIDCLTLIQETNNVLFFYNLRKYRTDLLRIYSFKKIDGEILIRDLMDFRPMNTELEIELKELIRFSISKEFKKYFAKLRNASIEYHQKMDFFRKYLMYYGTIYTLVCFIIAKLEISLVPKKLNHLLASISPTLKASLHTNSQASFYTAIFIYSAFVLLLYIFKFKRIYHTTIGNKEDALDVDFERAIYFVKGIAMFCLLQFLWPLISPPFLFAATWFLMMYYLLMSFGTYADYTASKLLNKSIQNNYLK